MQHDLKDLVISESGKLGLELVHTPIPYAENLPPEETEMIRLYSSERALQLPEIKMVLTGYVIMASQVGGFKLHSDPQELKVLITLLHEEIRDHFPNIKTLEVQKALNEGIRGNYGEYVGLSIKNIHNWLKAFLLNEKRNQAIKIYKERKSEMEYKELNEEEIENVYADAYASDLLKAKNGDKVFPTVQMYRWCERTGKIALTAEEKIRKFAKTEEQLNYLANNEFDQTTRKMYLSLLNKDGIASECMKSIYLEHVKENCNK